MCKGFLVLLKREHYTSYLYVVALMISVLLFVLHQFGIDVLMLGTVLFTWTFLGALSYLIEQHVVILRRVYRAYKFDINIDAKSPEEYIYTLSGALIWKRGNIERIFDVIQLLSNLVVDTYWLHEFKESTYELDYMSFYESVVEVLQSKYENVQMDDWDLIHTLRWAHDNPDKPEEITKMLY